MMSSNCSIHLSGVCLSLKKRSKIIPDTHALCTVMNDSALSSAHYEMSYFQMVHANHPTDLINIVQYDTVQFHLEIHKQINGC